MTQKVQGAGKFPGAVLFSRPVLIIAGILTGLALAVIIYKSMSYVSTDDAYIDGKVVVISPRVGAHVLQVPVEDNQPVAAGTPLVELDPRDFEVRVRIAAATLEAARAEDDQAGQDTVRYGKLSETGEISKQQLDRAVLRARTAAAKVEEAAAALRQAELNLSYTKIESPSAGHVARKSVETGTFVQPGQPLMAVVADQKWVVANFKETDLTQMHPGQKVMIRVDTYPGKAWPGHVDSIQRGTGARFSLFPPENATGNFVKVVQRIPVKILFDETPGDGYPLSVGMSVVSEVRVR